jgi:N6-adenosine-specific RNA methylase IME4
LVLREVDSVSGEGQIVEADGGQNVLEPTAATQSAVGKAYRTIVADPPWPFHDARSRPWASKGGRRSRDTFFPYETQPLEWIKALPVASLAEADAHLYLWVPAGFNREGIGVDVARTWGFDVVSEIVWDKINFGLGKFPRPQHEILLVCRRGTLPFQINNAGSVQRWGVLRAKRNGGRVHSAKPDAALDVIEQASPGPYVELFARRARFGWDYWGDESLGTAAFPTHDCEAVVTKTFCSPSGGGTNQ